MRWSMSSLLSCLRFDAFTGFSFLCFLVSLVRSPGNVALMSRASQVRPGPMCVEDVQTVTPSLYPSLAFFFLAAVRKKIS